MRLLFTSIMKATKRQILAPQTKCASIVPFCSLCSTSKKVSISLLSSLAVLMSPAPSISANPSVVDPPESDALTIKFNASTDPEIRKAQQALVEIWGDVTVHYVDPSFIGASWQADLQATLNRTYNASSSTDIIPQLASELLAKLEDPWTRILSGRIADVNELQRTGELESTGLFSEARRGLKKQELAVVYIAPGSSAFGAGVLVGDVITAVTCPGIDMEELQDAEARARAILTRPCTVALRRGATPLTVTLRPGPLRLQPLVYRTLPLGPSNAVTDAKGQIDRRQVAYFRVRSFAPAVVDDFETALAQIEARGIDPAGVVLDLRSNPGGVVYSGLRLAAYFLDPGSTITYVKQRDDILRPVILSPSFGQTGGAAAAGGPEAPDLLAQFVPADDDTNALVFTPPFSTRSALLRSKPLVILTDRFTASTAELLTAALHDADGARILGDRTFGKGRTQRVFPLPAVQSTLFISNAEYFRPDGAGRVDKVGVAPDQMCSSSVEELSQVERADRITVEGKGKGNDLNGAGDEATPEDLQRLLNDTCVRRGLEALQVQLRTST